MGRNPKGDRQTFNCSLVAHLKNFLVLQNEWSER